MQIARAGLGLGVAPLSRSAAGLVRSSLVFLESAKLELEDANAKVTKVTPVDAADHQVQHT